MDKKLLVIIVVAILAVAGVGTGIVLMNNGGGGGGNDSRDLNVDLEIYGNADKNSKIDENDALLVERYIDAKSSGDAEAMAEISPKINLTFADANNDGKIDAADVEQIRAIAAGNATHLWFIDGIGQDRDMDIGSSIKRIGTEYYSNTEAMLILGQNDKVVAVDNAPYQYLDFYFNDAQKPNITNMVNMNDPDYPFINSLDLDVLLIFSASASYEAKQEKLVGTDVLFLGLYNPDLTNTEKSSFIQGILKAGYIFGAVDRAVDYTNWVIDYRDKMLNIANSIPDKDKPIVGMSNYHNQYFANGTSNTMTLYTDIDPLGQAVILYGGKNILEAINVDKPGYSFKVGIDAVFASGVKHFFCHNVKYTYSAMTLASTPEHGYLVDDYTEFKDAGATALSQEFMTDETVTLIAGDFRNGCTGGILLAAYMGHYINPDKYADIDPIAMHNEYIGWMGIEGYDLNEHGVFFYTAEPGA